jgi:hypothetical protein
VAIPSGIRATPDQQAARSRMPDGTAVNTLLSIFRWADEIREQQARLK